jgi:hypothetical protein
MKFGWLHENITYETNDIIIYPCDDFDKAVAEVIGYEESSEEWTYAPYEISSGIGKTHKKSNEIFSLPCTHAIQAKNNFDDDFMKYMIIMFGFCKGLRLVPEGWQYFYKAPLKVGALVDFFCTKNETVTFLECCARFWQNHSQSGTNKTFQGIVHSFLLSQSYNHLYEKFILQYMVTDACYHLLDGGIKITNTKGHCGRVECLKVKFGLDLPQWAVVCKNGTKNTSTITEIRNRLIHEGLWGGEAIGFCPTPNERNIVRELICFNARLISAMLGYVGEYSKSSCQTRQTLSFGGSLNPSIALNP